MRKKLLTTSMATALFLAASAAANAVTFDFTNFTGPSSNTMNTYSAGGVSIDVTAMSLVSGATNPMVKENTSPALTTPNPGYYRGVGVVSDGALNGMVNPNERLDITIPAGYQVRSVTLAGTSGHAFTLLVDNVSAGSGTIAVNNDTTADARQEVLLPYVGGTTLSIFSDAMNASGGVWLTELRMTAAVPLPAGGLLLAGGLVAMGAARRRAKA